MDNYAQQFAKTRPQAKWLIGDRVFGHWHKIPFVGTVLIDNMVTEEVGPRVLVQLDLPLKYKQEYKNIIEVKQKELKKLIKY